jgi:type 1 glutamine amidotransferase
MKTLGTFILCLGALITASCGAKTNQGAGGTDSNTHWLARCTDDGDCRDGLSCVCGACTTECNSASSCENLAAGALCLDVQCEGGDELSVCSIGCSGDADCPSGTSCQGSACTPNRAEGSVLEDSGANMSLEPTDTEPAASESATSDVDAEIDAGDPVTPSQPSSGNGGASGTPDAGPVQSAPQTDPEPAPAAGGSPTFPPEGAAGMPALIDAGSEVGTTEPYEPREGTFNVLVYSKTAGFRHSGSINTGQALLQDIADEWGFSATFTESNELITVEGLSQFELVFFLNSTGDIFNANEQLAYETWMTEHNGAFAGTHAAADTENGWAFFSEVMGQYYNGHGPAGTSDQVQFDASLLNHPAVAGLPNPWQRVEEWMNFNDFQSWSVKPGFGILGTRASDGQPVAWVREWGNFRSFYTALGHDSAVFTDNEFKQHLTGGLLWSVRREHWLQ